MRIVNEAVLAEFRGLRCSWCGWGASSEPHHIFGKGCGGGGRLDVLINLIGLCRLCHTKHHAGRTPTTDQLLRLVAIREKTTPEAIRDELNRLRRAGKNGEEPRR